LTSAERCIRRVARVVVLDSAQSVLLVRYLSHRPDRPGFWVVPGGALEAGETHQAAAARELREETGLSAEIGPKLWSRDVEFDSPQGMVRQHERFYLVDLTTFAPHVRNISPEGIQEHRWWTLPDLRVTTEVIYPEGLATAISGIVESRARRAEDP
jgi:8-oxo-dGTP pyrophosphatase MutT (NUDIX family)